ncbi:helix-turn-helix domain-containing protein [Paracoccus aerius]|nr:helix-turn-helix domain-containing protein [Paracoccus aerius]
MASHYHHLSFEERRKIAKWREGKMPVNGGVKSGHAAA